MFLLNTDPVARTMESADDITAALTAPSPITDTTTGHRYSMTIGNIKPQSSYTSVELPGYAVWFQS